MPQALADSDIVEQLRQRGLIATGGNIRLMPFADPANANGSAVAASTSSSNSGTTTPNPDGTITVTDATGNPVVVDPKTATPEQVQQLPDDSVNRLMPFLTGALGAATALYLANRNKKPPVTGSETGDMVAANSRGPAGSDIIDGEFTEVPPNAALNDNAVAGALTEQRKISGPTNRLQQMATPPDRSAIATAVAERAATGQPNDVGIINAADEFADFAPDELATARAIAQRLVDARKVGNARYHQGKKGVGRPAKPTSRNRVTETADEMMHEVARVLRDQKALRSLQKVAH